MSRNIKVTTNRGLIEEENCLSNANGMMPDDDMVNHPSHSMLLSMCGGHLLRMAMRI